MAERCGSGALAVQADVTRREDVQRLLAAALDRFGQVDAWVNNAGRGISKPVEQLSDEDVDAMVRDNLKSVLYGVQAVLPHFKERRAGRHRQRLLVPGAGAVRHLPLGVQRVESRGELAFGDAADGARRRSIRRSASSP